MGKVKDTLEKKMLDGAQESLFQSKVSFGDDRENELIMDGYYDGLIEQSWGIVTEEMLTDYLANKDKTAKIVAGLNIDAGDSEGGDFGGPALTKSKKRDMEGILIKLKVKKYEEDWAKTKLVMKRLEVKNSKLKLKKLRVVEDVATDRRKFHAKIAYAQRPPKVLTFRE